jgi:hypothetical protein
MTSALSSIGAKKAARRSGLPILPIVIILLFELTTITA